MKLFLVKPAPNATTDYDEIVSAVVYASTPEEAVNMFYEQKYATDAPVVATQVPRAKGVVHSHFQAG